MDKHVISRKYIARKLNKHFYQEDDPPRNQKACTRTPKFSDDCRRNIQSN